jgi:outer membrane protein assembly factor BamE (lipoprotein component of BamABCDE complex)
VTDNEETIMKKLTFLAAVGLMSLALAACSTMNDSSMGNTSAANGPATNSSDNASSTVSSY